MAFGDFQPLCTNVPSFPWCNLFYRQLQRAAPTALTGLSADSATAPVGVNPICGIPRASPYNVANIAACGISISLVSTFLIMSFRRKAAVGRLELVAFLALYILSLPLQLFTTGAFLEQGSSPLVILTAIHAGVVLALFMALFLNAFVAMQIVEDGTPASTIPFGIFVLITLGLGIYFSLDTAFGITTTIGGLADPPERLQGIGLFVLLLIVPPALAIVYLCLMTYVVLVVLRERKPMWWYILAASLFILSQIVWFLLGRTICKGTNSKIDASFIATILETASVATLYYAWRSITEESWEPESGDRI